MGNPSVHAFTREAAIHVARLVELEAARLGVSVGHVQRQEARRQARERFDREPVVSLYEDLYHRVLGRKAPGSGEDASAGDSQVKET